MGVLFAFGFASFAIQALVATQLFVIARAPGWGRARPFAWLAVTASLYAAVYAIATSRQHTTAEQAQYMAIYLLVGTVHGAAWVWYARAPDARRWSDLPRSAAWHIAVVIGLVTAAVISGPVADSGQLITVQEPPAGLHTERPLMSLVGLVVTAATASLYAVSAYALWRRRAEAGMPLLLAGYALFLASVLMEIAIAALGWQLPYLAAFSFPAAIVPVAMQHLHRFFHDAERLAWLSSSLQGQLASRTEERDVARDALLRQERVASIGRLASGLAHELSNPLQHIALSIDELQTSRLLTTGTEGRLLRDVGHGVERMQQIVHRLQDLVDHGDLHMTTVQLDVAVRQAVALTASHSTGAVVVQVAARRVAAVTANEAAVVRAIVALILNAIEALRHVPSGRQRRVDICTRTTPEGLPSVEVRDSGVGLPPHVLSHAGEPFFKSGDAVGLGLFAVHRIMHAHNGRVILGNMPSGGAMIALVFPAATAALPTAAKRSPVVTAHSAGALLAASVTPATILVVDDEPLLRHAFTRVLERAGHRVLRAEHGRAALELLRNERVDLVITDVTMPVMDGVEFAAVLAECHPSLRERLVVVCGGAVTADAAEFLNSPGLRVLSKPVTPSELIGVVSATLGAPAPVAHPISTRESPSSPRP
jgi:signal transduction histidine kinase/ActR/RegA family two-component response regulator